MRPLRQTYETHRVPKDPHPSEPVAVLSFVGRAAPSHDPDAAGDRAFFGLDEAAMRELGGHATVSCELGYTLLERAGVWFERLSGLRVGVVHAGPTAVDLPAVPRILGLSGPVLSTTDEPRLFSAVHLGAQLIRADEADLVLALADGDGSGAWAGGVGLCLGRADKAGTEDWVMAALLSGVAVGHGDPDAVTTLAATRAGFPHLRPEGGAADLPRALAEVGGGTGSVLLVERAAGRTVALVVAPTEPQSMSDRTPRFLGLSARSGTSVAAHAAAVAAEIVDSADLVAFAMDAARRPSFEHRVAVPVTDVADVVSRLRSFAGGDRGGVSSGSLEEGAPTGVVFVFPPSGAQLARAADRLYETEPTFRDALNRCDRIARPHLPRAILSVLFPSPGRESEIDDPGYANPVTFALGWALAELLRSFGVEPCAVVGCGVGELVAAAVAGSVELEQAMRLAVERGRLVRGLDDSGARAVLGASEELVVQLLAGEAGVDLVAVPRPGRTIVGGESGAVARFVDRCRMRGIKAAEVPGNPVHTPLVDPILEEYRTAAAPLEFRAPDVPVISTVTGRALTTAGADHWVGTLRAPLRFVEAVATAADLGGRTFVELGARPTLGSAGEHTLRGRGVRFVPALVPQSDDQAHLSELLAALWVRGAPINHQCTTRVPSQRVLPAYAFDRRPLAGPWVDDSLSDDTVSTPTWWLPDLPEEEAEITLVPADETRVDELLDLGRPAGPAPLEPMFLPPTDDADDGMSVDSDPISDITLDDLRYQGPGRQRRLDVPALEEPAGTTADDLLGQQGPCWAEEWRPDPVSEVLLEPTTFVVLTDGGLGDAICAMAEGAGHRVLRVEFGAEVPRAQETLFVPDPLAEDAWMGVLDAIGTLFGTVQLVHLWSAKDEALPDSAGWPSVVTLAKEMAAEGLPASLHLVTAGAWLGDTARDAASGVWGVAGLVANETDLFAGIVDVDPADPDVVALFRHIVAQAAEGAVPGAFQLRGDARLRRHVVTRPEPPRPEGIDTSGTWVLGGDVDALMLDLASWLASRGVKRLFLVGPAAPPSEVLKAALDLQKKGTACIVVRADATDPKGADAVRQRLAKEKKLSGAFLRFQPTPSALREIDATVGLAQWRVALRTAELLAELVGPDAPVFAWSEARAFDGAPGNGVGAAVATTLAGRLQRRPGHSALVHTGPHTTLPPGESVRLVTGLCALGGQWGVWLP